MIDIGSSSQSSALEVWIGALIAGVRNRHMAAIAQAISLVENEDTHSGELTAALYPHSGDAEVVGLTGPPGAGKSALAGALAQHYLSDGYSVGIVAVDPSSASTGGAVLGDRVRMSASIGADPRSFIRSMGTRGRIGGLCDHAIDAARILDAAGYEKVLIETVGVGQNEIDVASSADVCVAVLVPGAGDGVQAVKAGLMEIADIFVVNKSDLPGARVLRGYLASALGNQHGRRIPKILCTNSITGDGIAELCDEIDRFLTSSRSDGEFEARRRRNLETELRRRATALLMADLEAIDLSEEVQLVLEGKTDPTSAAERAAIRIRGLHVQQRTKGRQVIHE